MGVSEQMLLFLAFMRSLPNKCEWNEEKAAALAWNSDAIGDVFPTNRWLIVDCTCMFYMMDGCFAWADVFQRIARRIDDTNKYVNARKLAVCFDGVIQKNKQREYVAAQRRKKLTNTHFVSLPDPITPLEDINVNDPTHFPFPGATALDFLQAYLASKKWRQVYLYPMLQMHLGKYFQKRFDCIYQSGLTEVRPTLLYGTPDPLADIESWTHTPVEGDCQIATWLHVALKDPWSQKFQRTPDGDNYAVSMLLIDYFTFTDPRPMHNNEIWWLRPASAVNQNYMPLVLAHYELFQRIHDNESVAWAGVMMSLIVFICGNDYCNNNSKLRVQGIDMMMYVHALLSDTARLVGAVYLAAVDGRVMLEIHPDILIPLLKRSRGKNYTTSDMQWFLLWRNLVCCVNYYMLAPLLPLNPRMALPEMTLMQNGVSVYGYEQTSPTSDIECTLSVITRPFPVLPNVLPRDLGYRLDDIITNSMQALTSSPPPVTQNEKTDEYSSIVNHYLTTLCMPILSEFTIIED